ncbi:MAG: hypothetical protein WCO82_10545 [Sphingomonadales bacterium]|jgi:hypothetical protein
MSDLDWIALAAQRAKGKRPAYFEDPAVDRLLSITLALAGEVSVLRQRLDTVERLLEAKGNLDRSAIESFTPDAATARERGEATSAFVHRVMRGVIQDMQAMAGTAEPPLEDVSQALRDS